MNISRWLIVVGCLAPLLSCSSADSSSTGGKGGTGGGTAGSGGAILGGAGGGTGGGGVTGGMGGGVITGGAGGAIVGGSGGGVVGGSGGGTASCPSGTTQVDNGGTCMCVVDCTQGDDTPCQVVAGGHCCDFSSYGYGFMCGGDQSAACDSLIGAQCGAGGSTGTGGTGGATGTCSGDTTQVDNGGTCMCVVNCTQGNDTPCQVVAGGHCCDFSSYGYGFMCGGDQSATCDSLIGSQCQ